MLHGTACGIRHPACPYEQTNKTEDGGAACTSSQHACISWQRCKLHTLAALPQRRDRPDSAGLCTALRSCPPLVSRLAHAMHAPYVHIYA